MTEIQTPEVVEEVAPVAPAAPESAAPAEKTISKAEHDAAMAKMRIELKERDQLRAELDEIKTAQLSEQEKVAKERDDALAKAAELEARFKATERTATAKDVAVKVATDLGISVDAALKLAPKLDGDTAEELEASARELFPVLKPTAAPVPGAVHDVLSENLPENDPIRKAFLGTK